MSITSKKEAIFLGQKDCKKPYYYWDMQEVFAGWKEYRCTAAYESCLSRVYKNKTVT